MVGVNFCGVSDKVETSKMKLVAIGLGACVASTTAVTASDVSITEDNVKIGAAQYSPYLYRSFKSGPLITNERGQ